MRETARQALRLLWQWVGWGASLWGAGDQGTAEEMQGERGRKATFEVLDLSVGVTDTVSE